MKVKGKKAVRYHPIFVRWCPAAYEVLRESGFNLPTQRRLNDYTHWVQAKPGF